MYGYGYNYPNYGYNYQNYSYGNNWLWIIIVVLIIFFVLFWNNNSNRSYSSKSCCWQTQVRIKNSYLLISKKLALTVDKC